MHAEIKLLNTTKLILDMKCPNRLDGMTMSEYLKVV